METKTFKKKHGKHKDGINLDYKRFIMNLLRFKTNIPLKEKEEIAFAFYKAEKEINDPCIDNHRFIYDDSDITKYKQQVESGCCGFFDKKITLSTSKVITIGFNYGH